MTRIHRYASMDLVAISSTNGFVSLSKPMLTYYQLYLNWKNMLKYQRALVITLAESFFQN